jgi:hypothetical protein
MSSAHGSWAPTTMTITGTGSVIHGVQINGWNFASSSMSGTMQPTSSAAGSTSNPTGTGGAYSGTGSNGGLSSGAKAGVGIAVAVGVIGICALVAAFLFYRKRRNSPSKVHEVTGTPSDPYSQFPAPQYGGIPKDEKYTDTPHAPQYYVAPVEVSGESKPAPPVEIG